MSDLPVALEYMLILKNTKELTHLWPLRYAILLWLSLICMLPFDLAQFDSPNVSRGGINTIDALEMTAMLYLDKAGLEKDASAILLSRLYTR